MYPRAWIQAGDFQRLYTNIDRRDMQANIMQLVRNIFALDSHHTHTGIKQKQ